VGGAGGQARGRRGIMMELKDETTAPDEDPRRPATGRCSGGGSTR
jgi:hypothetical protein